MAARRPQCASEHFSFHCFVNRLVAPTCSVAASRQAWLCGVLFSLCPELPARGPIFTPSITNWIKPLFPWKTRLGRIFNARLHLKTQVQRRTVASAPGSAAGALPGGRPDTDTQTPETHGGQGLLLLLWGPSFDTQYSLLMAFWLILNFIRSNIIDYIIKCKTYIIKIAQHFTDHLIKISGAGPKKINLHEASSTYYSALSFHDEDGWNRSSPFWG